MKKTLMMIGATAFALTTVAPAMAHMTRAQAAMAKKCKAMSHRAMMRNKACMSLQRKRMMSTDMAPKDDVRVNRNAMPGDGVRPKDRIWIDTSAGGEAPKNSGTMKKH